MQFRVYNKHLDQNLWNKGKQLNPEVRTILLKIAKDYYEGNKEIEGALVDAYIVGSSANYNWTPDSDLDLHLVLDASKLEMDEETARTLFELMAHKWNQNHDIKIKGHNVELYIQDVNHNVRSSGIYSLTVGEWIKEPHPEKVEIDEEDIKQKYRNMVARIDNAIQEQDVPKMKKVMEDLRDQRNTGLDKSGEFSMENIVFKMLRRFGNIEKLKIATHQFYDREMTLTERLEDKNDLIIGYITPSLKIGAKTRAEIEGHRGFKEIKDWFAITSWRFRKDLNLLFWWPPRIGSIEQNERDAVVDFLEAEYGAHDIKQKMLIPSAGMNSDSWDISHGVEENITEEMENPDDLIIGYISPNYKIQSATSRRVFTHGNFSGQKWGGQDRSIAWRFRKDLNTLYWWGGESGERPVSPQDREEVLNHLNKKYGVTGHIHQKIIMVGDNPTRMDKQRAHGVFEMANLSLKNKKVFANDIPLRGLPLEKVEGNIAIFRQPNPGEFIPEGFTLLYFLDSDESALTMKSGKIPYLMVPRGTFYSGGSPITDIWKKKFQKPGTEHIIGVIEGSTDSEEIFIDMITVRPGWQRNSVATLMMNAIKKMYPNAKVSTSNTTDKGKKFFGSIKENNETLSWVTGMTNGQSQTVSEKYSGHVNNLTHRMLSSRHANFIDDNSIEWRYHYLSDIINFWTDPTEEQRDEIYAHLQEKYGISTANTKEGLL